MSLGRKMSPEVAERHAADKELAAGLDDRLAAAQEAEERLRAAKAERRPGDEVHALAVAYDQALQEAILAADAAERVAMGPKTYEHGDASHRRTALIATRRARAKPSVRPYTDEVTRLRSIRERHKLTYRTSPSVAGSSSPRVAERIGEPVVAPEPGLTESAAGTGTGSAAD